MALDSRYIADYSLEQYFVDKDTGEPLAGGSVEFYKDDDRTTPKVVYQLSGAPPNYTYTALPNPITLSAVGTIQNAGGDNLALYYFPYDSEDADANLELYYIVVKDSGGTTQFTREAWPNITSGTNPVSTDDGNYVNQLTNPQFTTVNFDPSVGLTINYTGSSTTTTTIAKGWDLVITHSGAGSVTVGRTSIAGSQRFPTNPPYTLDITAGVNITQMRLRQRLLNNPDIWAPVVEGERGYIAGGAMLGDNTQVTMYYTPSVGTEQQVFTANNQTGDSEYYTDTVQLDVASNTDTSDTGYVDISLQFPVTGSFSVSSIQVVHLESDQQNIPYDQVPVININNEAKVYIEQDCGEIYGEDAEASDAYVISLDPTIYSYVTGQIVTFKANTANTGAATINVDGLGAVDIKKNYNEDLATGDILADQIVMLIYDGTNFQMLSQLGNAANTGQVIQVVQGTKTDTASTSSTTFSDTGVTVSITPSDSANKVLITADLSVSSTTSTATRGYFRLLRDSTAIYLGDTAGSRTRVSVSNGIDNELTTVSLTYLDSPSTTSATTYKIQYASAVASGTPVVYINRSDTDSDASQYPRGASSITAMEVKG